MPLTYTVKPGDCLFRIAHRHGFHDWRTIYNHPSNARFRQLRPNPNVIYPGDRLQIPGLQTKRVEIPTGRSALIKVKVARTMLRILLHDEEGEPLVNKKFKLKLQSGIYEGTTTGDGILEQSVAADEVQAELTVWDTGDENGPQYHWDLRIGYLDPVEEVTGVQQRLNNLGFYCGDSNGEVNEVLQMALRGFQHLSGLEKTGEIDDATRSKLVELHGGV